MSKTLKMQQRYNLTNMFWIILVHVVSIGAVFYLTWTNIIACLVGVFILAPMGINVGYHRLLCHRGFVAPRWLRNSLAVLGAMLGAGAPVHWVAMHRVHHRFSDTDKDPHNSRRGFWFSHILHLFILDELEQENKYLETYAPDLMADPFLSWLNKYWLWIAFAVLPILYLVGGMGLVLWAGFVRMVLSWHIMWFVNSASHLWGYRNYDSDDHTVNCWWVGFLAAGEGWHNNHHADPSCAAHGHRWWEFDFSFLIIRALACIGLATDIKLPRKSK